MKIKSEKASKDVIKEGKMFFDRIEKKMEESNTVREKAIDKKIVYKIGDQVSIISKNVKGTILDKSNKKGEYLIQVGLIKMNFHKSDLKLIKEKPVVFSEYSSIEKPQVKKALTLDLRGARYDEAEKKLDKFIEESIYNQIKTVRIIHGKGTGALKKCIQDFLESSFYVIDYDFEKGPEDNATNFGVTIAHLK